MKKIIDKVAGQNIMFITDYVYVPKIGHPVFLEATVVGVLVDSDVSAGNVIVDGLLMEGIPRSVYALLKK